MAFNLKSAFIISTLSLAISSFSALTKPTFAGLFLSPMYLKMESKEGQSKGVIQVGNTSPQPIRVRLYLTDFTYSEDGTFQRKSELNQTKKATNSDLSPYLNYSPREMIIPGNSSRRVRLISLLPPSLPEGEYRTAIFAETLQEKTNAQGFKVGFNMSIGSALYVAKGEIKPDVTIVTGNLEQQQLKLLVNNKGNATAKGKIDWTLKQGKKAIASGKSGGSFLPNSQTNLVLNRQQKLEIAPGVYRLSGTIVWSQMNKQQVSNFEFELNF